MVYQSQGENVLNPADGRANYRAKPYLYSVTFFHRNW